MHAAQGHLTQLEGNSAHSESPLQLSDFCFAFRCTIQLTTNKFADVRSVGPVLKCHVLTLTKESNMYPTASPLNSEADVALQAPDAYLAGLEGFRIGPTLPLRDYI